MRHSEEYHGVIKGYNNHISFQCTILIFPLNNIATRSVRIL